ncbi:MAG: ribonuclease III domain-containing protein [Bacillota bacterium]|nr:ribonuclease III domain-containing protein [Bacillota bacterium]HHT89817.1 Mini-ribonuclease 3 [Bacillota bacterium]
MFIDPKLDPKELSPLVLAYVGDAVYELYIRTRLAGYPAKMHKLHRMAVKYVQASKQAEIVHRWEPELTEDERNLVRRGRNAKGGSSRHGDVVDYRYSTGLEALLGYLYLTGQEERLQELLSEIDPTEP